MWTFDNFNNNRNFAQKSATLKVWPLFGENSYGPIGGHNLHNNTKINILLKKVRHKKVRAMFDNWNININFGQKSATLKVWPLVWWSRWSRGSLGGSGRVEGSAWVGFGWGGLDVLSFSSFAMTEESHFLMSHFFEQNCY